MSRKIMIDPNIWASEDFSRLSQLAKLVFISMFSHADDDGRGKANAVYLRSVTFSFDEKQCGLAEMEKALDEIAELYVGNILHP